MIRPVFVRPEAQQDVVEILESLERPRAVRKFESRYKGLLSQISVMLYIFDKFWRSVRCVKVKGFKYVLYYMVTKHYIDVFAVMHGARDASAWKSRL